MNGKRVIENAVKSFTSVIKKLEAGVKACESRVEENKDLLASINDENITLDASITRGNRVIRKINEIVG